MRDVFWRGYQRRHDHGAPLHFAPGARQSTACTVRDRRQDPAGRELRAVRQHAAIRSETMTRVFILSTYEEHGAFGVVATLDQDKIIPLIRERFKDFDKEAIDEAVSKATYLLASPLPDQRLLMGPKQQMGRHSIAYRGVV